MKVRIEYDPTDWIPGVYIVPETEFEGAYLKKHFKEGTSVRVKQVWESNSLDDQGILFTNWKLTK